MTLADFIPYPTTSWDFSHHRGGISLSEDVEDPLLALRRHIWADRSAEPHIRWSF